MPRMENQYNWQAALPAQALAAIGRTRTTALPGVPTMYQALLDHPDLAKTDFSSLRVCISGGAPMPAELREKFTAATGASLVEGYGLTESSGVVATNPYDGPVRPGTIGQPLPATHIRLIVMLLSFTGSLPALLALVGPHDQWPDEPATLAWPAHRAWLFASSSHRRFPVWPSE